MSGSRGQIFASDLPQFLVLFGYRNARHDERPEWQDHVGKKSNFTEEQIVFALKLAELGARVEEVCREMGISGATFCVWKKRNGGVGPFEQRRLRQLEEENRQPKQLAYAINGIWSVDFVADALFDGRKLRMLTVVDLFTRECLAVDVGQSLKGDGVARVLTVIAETRGLPRTIKFDNGSEFTSKAMDKWAYERGVELDFSHPGKPTDNAHVESFHGRLRRECLNASWSMSLDDARGDINGAGNLYFRAVLNRVQVQENAG